MNYIRLTRPWCLGCWLLLLGFVVSACQPGEVTVISGVTVVDVAQGISRAGMSVLIDGTRISELAPTGELSVPRGAHVVEATGKYLIPGLWDMHVHISSDLITREIILPLFIAHGVTGVRIMSADCFEAVEQACGTNGHPSIAEVNQWRREIAAGTLVGPAMVAGSYYVNGPSGDEESSIYSPGTPEHAREHARLLAQRGLDFIKIYDLFPREAYFALAEEAQRLGVPIEGHVPVRVTLPEAARAGQRTVDHIGFGTYLTACSSMEEVLRVRLFEEYTAAEPQILPVLLGLLETYDAEKCASVMGQLRQHGTWIVPTLMVSRLPEELTPGWREDPLARFLHPREREVWEELEALYTADLGMPSQSVPIRRWSRAVVASAYRAGVPLLAGSDAGDPGVFWGRGLHEELELLVAAGLTEAEALRAATLEPARFYEATDSLGAVAPGMVADLVLLDRDPLQNISHIREIAAVFTRGRLLDRATLDALLAEVEGGAS